MATATTTPISGRFVNNDDNRYSKEKPYIYHGPDLGFPQTNLVFKEASFNTLTDLRKLPESERPTVNSHGFCLIENESKALRNMKDDADSQPNYANEMAEVLTKVLGATKVVPVHTALRSANKDHKRAPPGTEAHMDTTMYDAWGRIRALLSQEEQEKVLSGEYRARIVNLWRPYNVPAHSHPLAILDPNTVTYDKDHFALDHVTPNFSAETAYLTYNANHKWFWMSSQTPDEAWVFTQYDTHPPNRTFNHVGHCAFANPSAPPDAPPRQSIEARFTVLSPAPYSPPFNSLIEPRPKESRRQVWKDVIKLEEKEGVTGWRPTYERKQVDGVEIVEGKEEGKQGWKEGKYV